MLNRMLRRLAGRTRRFALLCLLSIAVLAAAGTGAFAIGVDEPLPDQAQELRAREISKTLRCLVCQNQSIEDSNAGLAKDLRQIVRDRVIAGDSDDQVRAYVVARYGDWVLLKPPFNALTALLWIGPALILLGAAVAVFFYYRRLRQFATAPAEPLTADERKRLEALLSDGPRS